MNSKASAHQNASTDVSNLPVGRSRSVRPNELKRSLRTAALRKHGSALLLIAPLALFLIAVFLLPVWAMISRSVESQEVTNALPSTTAALRHWDPQTGVPDAAFRGLMMDLERNGGNNESGQAAGRLNAQREGFRSLFFKTSAALPFDEKDDALSAAQVREKLIETDKRWADPAYWITIAKNSSPYTSQYLLATIDYQRGADGSIIAMNRGESNYKEIFGRTFLISFIVTIAALLLGYPLSYWISSLPTGRANIVMILVLLPFWTSILVRISAWIVILQGTGLVNKGLMALHLISAPLPLLFNRAGVLISMTHILLPFMILPLYSVMKTVSPSYVKAAISLGSHPFGAFWKVYFPQTLPGIGAGGVLVFITALGCYITPALLGGAGDQMISYYIAYFTNVSLNWGMACALGAVLLLITLLLFSVYRLVVGKELSVS